MSKEQLTREEAKKLGWVVANWEFQRLPKSARQAAVDLMLHELRELTPANVRMRTMQRCNDQLRPEGLIQPRGGPLQVPLAQLGRWSKEQPLSADKDNGEQVGEEGSAAEVVSRKIRRLEWEADPETLGWEDFALTDIVAGEVDATLTRCFEQGAAFLEETYDHIVKGARAGAVRRYHQQRAATGLQVMRWGCEAQTWRDKWTDTPRTVIFTAMQRWARYPAGRYPTRPDVQRYAHQPAADWQWLASRGVPVIETDIRTALQHGYDDDSDLQPA